MRKAPPSDYIPFFMFDAIYTMYESGHPRPVLNLHSSLDEWNKLGEWYAASRRFREEQAWRILQIRPGWSASLDEGNAVAVATAFFGFLYTTTFVKTWWRKSGERYEQRLHLPPELRGFLKREIPYRDAGNFPAIMAEFRAEDEAPSWQEIYLFQNYTASFEAETLSFTCEDAINLTFRVLSRSGKKPWHWYTYPGIEAKLLEEFIPNG